MAPYLIFFYKQYQLALIAPLCKKFKRIFALKRGYEVIEMHIKEYLIRRHL